MSATASQNEEGIIHLSLSNVDADNEQIVTVEIPDKKIGKVTGQLLTANTLNDHNTFDNPEVVQVKEFKNIKVNKGNLEVKVPAKGIVTIEIR